MATPPTEDLLNRQGHDAGAARPRDGLARRFDDIGLADLASVGGKNASLGEMVRALGKEGIKVPPGFATTADAFRDFVQANAVRAPLEQLLDRCHRGLASLPDTGTAIRRLFLAGSFPHDVELAIRQGYLELGQAIGSVDPAVAVRSSATAEDLPGASFAGQQESFLNIRGIDDLLESCRRCYASLFTDRAITYREAQGFDHLDVALSIGVQAMVRADLAGAGVMFTLDTDTGFPRAVVITAAWGLGETVVQGKVEPDRFMVFKPLLTGDHVPLIERTLGAKHQKLIYATGERATELVDTSDAERRAFVLEDGEAIQLAKWGVAIERHYGQPMDIEWAKDGVSGELFILQARPETVQAHRKNVSRTYSFDNAPSPPLASGAAIGDAIVTGDVCLIRDPHDIARFRDGAILVTEKTDPDWGPILKRAAGIITDHGGATSHAAIVSRELGVPAIVGTGNATNVLKDGDPITLSCAEGERGHVYPGHLPYEVREVDLASLPATRTELMVNLADPSAALRWWRLPAKGVGLARMEFIISNFIKAHPMALAHPERLTLPAVRAELASLSHGYRDGGEYFVDTLSLGIAKIAAVFHPWPTIVRLSDFKTNEYSHLLGGEDFEPREENPMLGFRGASRYADPRYSDGFALECRAVRRAREEMGFANIVVMVPFCRSPAEADRVLEAMAKNGLRRGERGLEAYVMCEIPSNVILADRFAERFDGFSIGSNDLTQLVLGVDRDSGDLASLFDERDEAVTRMIADVIGEAKKAGIKIGICGQAPSNYPDFAQFLVSLGIDSISLNPDSFLATLDVVARAEGTAAGPPASPPRMEI